MRNRHLRSSGQQGFTLLELMIVTTVFGIAIAIAAPSISDWIKTNRLKSASREVYNLFQMARLEAAKRNTSVALNFTNGEGPTGTCKVCIDNGENGGTAKDLDCTNEIVISEVTMPDGLSLFEADFGLGNKLHCGFNSRGVSQDNKQGAVKVKSNALPHFEITLSGAGNISMKRGT